MSLSRYDGAESGSLVQLMSLTVGSRIAHYDVTALIGEGALGSYSVTAKIGEGGMGEVYRARDTRLDRDVALKVLP